MDAVTMLRDLWRHRFALVGVLALSLFAGILVLYAFSPPFGLQSRKYTVGVANTRVLIDTPSSQVARVSPKGSGDLGMRADLLSRIMVEGTVKANIAKMAGLHPDALFGISQAAAANDLLITKPPRGASVLTTQVVTVNYSTQLPLIEVDTQAGDAATAERIADAAVKGLRDYVDQQAADTQVPDALRVRVTPLGQTQSETTTRGPKTPFAFIAIILVFGFGCATIVGIAAVARAWRRAGAAEVRQPDGDPDPRGRTRPGTDVPEHAAPAGISQLRQPEPVPAASGPAPLRPADEAPPAPPKSGRRAAAQRRRRSAS
jgi:hypothetical protein